LSNSRKIPVGNAGGASATPWEMEEEALAIILRHRPDLSGKSLAEARAILKAERPGKNPKLSKNNTE